MGTSGVSVRTSWWTPSRRARAVHRCSPCDAWRPGRPLVEHHEEVVAMGADGAHPPPHVVGPARAERVEQVAGPAPLVPQAQCGRIVRPRQSAVGQRDGRLERRDETLSRRDEHLGGIRQALVPDVERAGHLGRETPPRLSQQCRTLAQHALGVVGGTSALLVEEAQRVVEQLASPARPSLDDGEVLGREDRARGGVAQSLAARCRLPVHPGPAAAPRHDLRLDQCPALRGARRRPARSRARCPPGPAPRGALPGRSGRCPDRRALRARSSYPFRSGR